MSATSVKLLQVASEIAGGDGVLAERLGISEVLLGIFLADSRELPDALLLRVVDIILEDRHARLDRGLPQAFETPQNPGGGSGATSDTGRA